MNVQDIMQVEITTISPDTSVRAAAALMQALDVGILPICEDGRPIGVVTDRDIVIRLIPKAGLDADLPVSRIMSQPVLTCRADDCIRTVAAIMGDRQVRRLIALDDDGRIVGIVTVGDIARDADEALAGEILGEVVEFR